MIKLLMRLLRFRRERRIEVLKRQLGLDRNLPTCDLCHRPAVSIRSSYVDGVRRSIDLCEVHRAEAFELSAWFYRRYPV